MYWPATCGWMAGAWEQIKLDGTLLTPKNEATSRMKTRERAPVPVLALPSANPEREPCSVVELIKSKSQSEFTSSGQKQ